MGCYPLFTCRDWRALAADLDATAGDLVSVVMVADPFGDHTPELLERQFDVVRPFKQHYITEYRAGTALHGSRHHRYYARRALRTVDVERCQDPEGFLDEWCALYAHLVARHALSGIKAFSRAAFAEQLRVPGTVIFRAAHAGRTIGAHWYYVQGEVSYSHLAALSAEGYALAAAYALQWHAVDYFSRHVRWLNHGAVAGGEETTDSGLSRFKRGWANTRRTAYLCGRILAPEVFARLVHDRGGPHAFYFPPYRAGELA